VKPLTEQEIRAAFVNCTKGDAKRLNMPRDLAVRPWDDLDFLGWRDHQAEDRAYLAADVDGALVALVLRSSSPSAAHRVSSMCSLCLTTHTGGVSLLVAPRTGKAGQQGNTVGDYMCSDLACSLYVRGLKPVVGLGGRIPDSLTRQQEIDQTKANLADFIARVTA
jgi:FBP C-terminal treble-clef zinc-finger